MSRRRTSGRLKGFRTQAPKEGTLIAAAVLWLVGFADLVLGAFTLPNDLGLWALVAAGLLLIIASLIDGL